MRKLTVAAIFAVVVGLVAGPMLTASAGHHTYWFHVKAPFTGYWDKLGITDPTNHPGGGDWNVDFYQSAGTQGKWYVSASDAGSVGTYVVPSNACSQSSWTVAGLRYQVILSRSGADKGWFKYVHVDPRNPSGGTYSIGLGSSLSNGMALGWLYKYDYLTACWEVQYPHGVHWHVEAYNYSHYACWYGWGENDLLYQGSDVLGVVNSNATYAGAACW